MSLQGAGRSHRMAGDDSFHSIRGAGKYSPHALVDPGHSGPGVLCVERGGVDECAAFHCFGLCYSAGA